MRCLNPPRQRINLYQVGRDARQPQPVGTSTLAWLGGLGLLVILSGWGWISWQTLDLKQQYQQLHAQVQQREQQLATLRTRVPSDKPDPLLQAEQQRLEKRHNSLQKALALISGEQGQMHKGYSDILRGLARQPLDQLWLRNIRISGQPHKVTLGGTALDPAAVPRMLRSLGSDQAFSGLTFGRARLVRDAPDHGNSMSFELTSHPQKEKSDGQG